MNDIVHFNKMSLFIGLNFHSILLFLILIITLAFVVLKRIYTYWDRKGFKTAPGCSLFFGHLKHALFMRESFADTLVRLYNSTNEPFIGLYSLFRPVVLVRDLELVRAILIQDFANFTDRFHHNNVKHDPLSDHLLAAQGEKWKHLRRKLSPAFSISKLRAMFPTFAKCGVPLQNFLEQLVKSGSLFNASDISANYTTNVIASVGFGVEVDSITNPNEQFRVNGRKIFRKTISNGIRALLYFLAPKVMTFFRIKMLDADVEDFIRSIVNQNLEYREKSHIVRKDLFQSLVQLRINGTIHSGDEWNTFTNNCKSKQVLSVDDIAAQALLFFAAGFETSSTTLAFFMYELAKHPKVQQRLHADIDRVISKHNGDLTFESVSEMKYLEWCVQETLRKYSVSPTLPRMCTKTYRIPGTDKFIEKGTEVYLPIFAIQRDETYFDEPNEFMPERFSNDNLAHEKRHRAYMPFGDGPRNCIGAKIGKLQTKVGAIMMLQKFRYELSDPVKQHEIRFNTKNFLLGPSEDIQLRIFKR